MTTLVQEDPDSYIIVDQELGTGRMFRIAKSRCCSGHQIMESVVRLCKEKWTTPFQITEFVKRSSARIGLVIDLDG